MDKTPATKTDRVTIAIKMPAPLQERILSFPMIHLLREGYPEADLHFICPEHKIEMLFALPFEGFWHPLPDGRIQCDLCPRFCKLREGQRGLCFVRQRKNDDFRTRQRRVFVGRG